MLFVSYPKTSGAGRNEGEEPNSIPFLKRFTVFNAAQCEALPASLLAPITPAPERQIHEEAERSIDATGQIF